MRAAADILKEHPDYPAASLLLATAQRSCGDDPQAAAAFAQLAAAQPNSRLSCQITMREELDGLIVRMPEGQH